MCDPVTLLSLSYRINNDHKSARFYSTVTVNTKKAQEDVSKRRRRSLSSDEIYEQQYAMKAYVRSENKFMFFKGSFKYHLVVMEVVCEVILKTVCEHISQH